MYLPILSVLASFFFSNGSIASTLFAGKLLVPWRLSKLLHRLFFVLCTAWGYVPRWEIYLIALPKVIDACMSLYESVMLSVDSSSLYIFFFTWQFFSVEADNWRHVCGYFQWVIFYFVGCHNCLAHDLQILIVSSPCWKQSDLSSHCSGPMFLWLVVCRQLQNFSQFNFNYWHQMPHRDYLL